jgi:two-component system LytT family response regulator
LTKKVSHKSIRCIIVDDEELARSIIREHLGNHSSFDVIAECVNGFEAVKAITEQQPDLVFLDIQMPKLNGFEVLQLVEKDIAVIFITAYDQYAIKAFEVYAVDYLLKPFTRDRFDAALLKATEKIKRKESLPVQEILSTVTPEHQKMERVLIRNGSDVVIIPVDKIDYIEAQDDYACFVASGKRHLKQQRIAELEKALDPQRFVRIHRSYILNVDRLSKIELYAKDSRLAILKDGTKLQVSRAGHDKLKDLL